MSYQEFGKPTRAEWQGCLGDQKIACTPVARIQESIDDVPRDEDWRTEFDSYRQSLDACRRDCPAVQVLRGRQGRSQNLEDLPCTRLKNEIVLTNAKRYVRGGSQ